MNFLPFAKPDIDEQTIFDVVEVLKSGWLASGPKVLEFENALGHYLGLENGKSAFVKSFTSATGAMEIALRVMGIGPGDEVIVPAMTFAASANVIRLCGARPVIVDVDLRTRNITLETIMRSTSRKTKAIMPVHFAGLPADMDAISKFACEQSIRVLEDAAHAIGSEYKGKKVGSFGDVISFSFHPNKNMTTLEGGALVVRNKEEAEAIDHYRFHGLKRDIDGSLDIHFPSGKFNLSDVAAAVGLGQLRRLDEFNSRRRRMVARYFERLEGISALHMPERGDIGHSWHMFSPLIEFDKIGLTRSEFIARMGDKKIGIGVHYKALNKFTAYGGGSDQCISAGEISDKTVTLPLFSKMEISDVDRVCDAVIEIVGST